LIIKLFKRIFVSSYNQILKSSKLKKVIISLDYFLINKNVLTVAFTLLISKIYLTHHSSRFYTKYITFTYHMYVNIINDLNIYKVYIKLFFLAFCEANSFNICSKLIFCRTSFSVNKMIKEDGLSCNSKTLLLF